MIDGLIERQMRKSGGTVFRVEEVRVTAAETLFVRAADINELRRLAFSGHIAERQRCCQPQQYTLEANEVPWLSSRATCLDNITNSRAKDFYRRHGVTDFDLPVHGLEGVRGLPLMTTRYCIKAQLGICPKMSGTTVQPAEPLTLTDNTGVYELEFDCPRCEMIVRRRQDGPKCLQHGEEI